jgi:hypothetical protein
MKHLQTYKVLYLALLVFVSANCAAAVVVFGALSPEQLAGLSGRAFALDVVKCLGLASATLIAYVSPPPVSQPTKPPTNEIEPPPPASPHPPAAPPPP